MKIEKTTILKRARGTSHAGKINPPVLNTDSGENQRKGNIGHTPGPWHVGEVQSDLDREGNGYCWPVCALTKSERENSIPGKNYVQNPAYCNSLANAQLISAAPDMLAALEAFQDAFVHIPGDDKGNKVRTQIFKHCDNMRLAAVAMRTAIAKATGK